MSGRWRKYLLGRSGNEQKRRLRANSSFRDGEFEDLRLAGFSLFLYPYEEPVEVECIEDIFLF